MSVITMTEQIDVVTKQALTWPDRARGIRISDATTYTQAAELLKGIKALRQEVDATFDPIIAAAFKAHREACAQKKKAEAPLAEAEAILKRGCVDYDMEQERIAKAEEIRLREEARRAEEQRRLEEAAALEREGNETNNPELLYEANELIEQPVETPGVVVAKNTPKVNGISYRETWNARVTNLQKLIQFVAKNPQHANLLAPNYAALNGLARSLKTGMRIDGVEAVCTKQAVASGR